jgi:hypothetical protein
MWPRRAGRGGCLPDSDDNPADQPAVGTCRAALAVLEHEEAPTGTVR